MRIFLLLLFICLSANAQEETMGVILSKKGSAVAPPTGGGGGPQPPPQGECATCPNSAVIGGTDTYVPTSGADLANGANAGRTAIITNTFDATGITLAANQILVPNGGQITGTGINLNGAEIEINYQRAFSTSTRFSSSYSGCLTPENFGAASQSNDAEVFHALIDNASHAIGQSATVYNVNTPIGYQALTGDLDRESWNFIGSGCTIRSTYEDLAGPSGTAIATNMNDGKNEDYLFEFDGIDINWCNLTIDGNDALHFGVQTNANIYFNEVDFFDFYNDDPSERILMVNIRVYSNNQSQLEFQSCEFRGATPTDDGVITNAGGLTRGIIANYYEVNTTREYIINDCDFFSFYGEGEGIHTFPVGISNADWNHNVVWKVTNSRFGDNSRRDIKAQTSGLKIDNCVFNKIDPSSIWAGSTTVSIAMSLADNVVAGRYATNFELRNSQFVPWPGVVQKAWYVGMTGTRGAIIEGNNFNIPFISTAPGVTFSGESVNNTIQNNTFTNCGVTSVAMTSASSNNVVQLNDFNIDVDRSAAFTVFGDPPGTVGEMHNVSFLNNDVTMNFTNNNNQAHVFGTPRNSAWAGRVYQNVTLDGNNVLYTGPNAANKKFLFVQGNFDSTNSVINHNPANGVTASGAFEVLGTQTFTISNNVNGSGQTLTKL